MSNKPNRPQINKAELAYEQITHLVLNRELLPGERLVERDIARRLELSKTPVREALLRLREDGFVRGNFNTGVYVTMITPKDVMEIIDIRQALEGMAARRAAEKAKPEDLAELHSIIAKMEHFSNQNMSREYAKQDLDFHLAIVDIGGNGRLRDILRKLSMQYRILMISTMKLPGRGTKVTMPEHRAICEAIVNRDPQAAEASARRHIRLVRDAADKWMGVMS